LKVRKWLTVETRTVYCTPIFDLNRRRSSHPRRGQHDFYLLEVPNWVNIIPLTARNEVVMVRQFRHGIGGFTLEIPGGMMEPDDADPADAARREMVEESGYDSPDIIALGRVHPNPAMQGNYCYTYLARGVRKVAEPVADGAEETQVKLVPMRDVAGLIASGKISHALVIAAFSFLHFSPPARRRARPAR
jgi:ADP-ribose diphosphatase